MNTQTQTSPEVKPATNAIESCMLTAASLVRMAELLRNPAFNGFDKLGAEEVHNKLVQLFPRAFAAGAKETTARALAIAKIVPGDWRRDDDGAWRCELTGELTGFKLIIHRAEPARVSVVKPANALDIDATAKALAAA